MGRLMSLELNDSPQLIIRSGCLVHFVSEVKLLKYSFNFALRCIYY